MQFVQRLLTLLVLLLAAKASAQNNPPALYYKETYNGIEPVAELPHDTIFIHDTVYVSDIDAFLRKYFNKQYNLNKLLKNTALLEQTMDSLNKANGEQLYYNFFMRDHEATSLANSFIIKEFKVDPKLHLEFEEFNTTGEVQDQDGVSREILFRCEGVRRTERFLKDPDAVLQAISTLFTRMKKDKHNKNESIEAINLYFPDYNYREKRAMIQFIKSVRIVMDASRDYKFGKVRLNAIFHKPKGKGIEADFEYALMLKTSKVIFIDGADVLEKFYVKGDYMTRDELDTIGFFTRMKSHFYVARYSSEVVNIAKLNLTDFSMKSLAKIIHADYPENNWEPYLWILIVMIILVILLVVLYFSYLPFAYLLNANMGTVMICSIVFLIELVILVIMIFQHMCTEDHFSMKINPLFVFSLPVLMVVIIPLMRELSKGKRLP